MFETYPETNDFILDSCQIDERIIESDNSIDYSENKQLEKFLETNKKKPKARRSRIAANIFGKIDNN